MLRDCQRISKLERIKYGAREADCHRGAATGFAIAMYRAAMSADDRLNERQAEPDPCAVWLPYTAEAVKAFEQPIFVFWRDTVTMVANNALNLLVQSLSNGKQAVDAGV